jgi:hypothetical protein
MANNNHSRFFYTNRDQIQDGINTGLVNQWDIVICQDTKEQILITDEYEQVVIKSRVYRFEDVSTAEEVLNNSSDTYEGQVVSIMSNRGTYQAYIVNRGDSGKFVVQSISVYNAGDLNYADLGDRPITNLQGDIENPECLYGQAEGIYKIDGAYRLSATYPTIFQSSNSNLYLVSYDGDENCYIRIISASNITDYVINGDGEFIGKSEMVTTEWLEQQEFITDDMLDSKLAALNLMTKDNAQAYVVQLLNEYVEDFLDEKIDGILDEKLGERLLAEDNKSVTEMMLKILN